MALEQKLIVSQFSEASFRRNEFVAVIPHGLALTDILQPEFWANVAQSLSARDLIGAYAEDGSFYAELMVTFVPEKSITKPQNFAKVTCLHFHDLTEKVTKELPEGFELKWRGQAQKHCIIRKSDGTVVIEKQQSKVDAVKEFFSKKNQLAA